jgi:hypothetical protein
MGYIAGRMYLITGENDRVDDYDVARKIKEFARDLVAAMEREALSRSPINGRDGYASAAKMVYSRAESFLYFEFPADVYEEVREEFGAEIEYRRAMRPLEERLERQKAKEWLRAEERRLRQDWRQERIRCGIESVVLDRRENSAPPDQPEYMPHLMRLYRFVRRKPRGFAAGMHFSYLKHKYPEEYIELKAEGDVHHQTRRAARLALARNRISQESCTAVLAGEITLQRAKELGPNRTPDGLQKASETPRREPRPCLCGCAGTTRGGRFLPGHQARLLGIIRRQIRTDPVLTDLTEEQRAYARERNLLGWRGVPGALL